MPNKLLSLIRDSIEDFFVYPPEALQGRLKEELLRSHRLGVPFCYIEVDARHIDLLGTERHSDENLQAWKIAALTVFNCLSPMDVIGFLPNGRGLGILVINFNLENLERLKRQILRNLRDACLLDRILLRPKAPFFQVYYCTAQIEHKHQLSMQKMEQFNQLSEGFLHVAPFNYSELRQNRWNPTLINWVKRAIDFCGALIALILLSPLMLILALLVKFSSKGPIFFAQTRVGMNGDLFRMFKFRSMYTNAEQILADLRKAGLNEVDGPVFKMKDDPRITPIGHFLRKYSLDELPQFWNVLIGDMCLVGPRPPLPAEVAQYLPWHKMRLAVKPGLTCHWQVSGRSNIGFEEWMRLDNQYVRHGDLLTDLDLIRRTIRVVVKGEGAY